MIPAVALPSRSNVEQTGPLQSREEVLARYRHLRKISKAHHANAMKFLSGASIRQHARRLDLSEGRRIIVGSEDELALVCDLAIHTAPAGRSRAIDRYARNLPPPSGSDEALVLDAMRNARFGVLIVRCHHPSAGLILFDVFRDMEIWLVDEGLETWLDKGMAFATRYYTPEIFSVTAGVGMPVDRNLLEGALEAVPQLMRKPKLQAIDDPRLAETVYRAAIRESVMERMTYLDPPAEGYAA